MGLTRRYKTEVFLHLYLQFSTIFYAIFISDTCLRSRKSISKSNFDKISQSMAEINYFRFMKTEARHPGILFTVSILLFYVCLPNFLEIGRSAVEL